MMLKLRSAHKVDCALCSVHYLCLPKDLGTTEINELNNLIAHFIAVEKGEHVFHAQGAMQNLYAVYSGSCKDYWTDENGNERIDNFYLPGDIIGLESIPNRKYFFSLVALEDSQLCVIPIDPLFELMQKHDSLLKRIMHINSYKMQNDLHISRTTNTNQRVADFILNILYRLEERKKYTNFISLPMSQLDISNFLGMAHETVNRIIRKMVKEKIIKIDNKKIYIMDIERLKKIGTETIQFGQT